MIIYFHAKRPFENFRLETYPKSLGSKPENLPKRPFWGGVWTPKYFFKFWRYDVDSKNKSDQKLVSDRFSIFWSTFRQHLLTNPDFKIDNFEKAVKITYFSKNINFWKSILQFPDTFAIDNVFWKVLLHLQEHFYSIIRIRKKNDAFFLFTIFFKKFLQSKCISSMSPAVNVSKDLKHAISS